VRGETATGRLRALRLRVFVFSDTFTSSTTKPGESRARAFMELLEQTALPKKQSTSTR